MQVPMARSSLRQRLALLLPGASQRRRQIAAFAQEWQRTNTEAVEGPWWFVLGDSTAQGVGASTIRHGYVGAVADWLSVRDDVRWRVTNVSVSGATAAEVVAVQLPLLEAALAAASPPDLVSCAVGPNDLLRRTTDLFTSLETVAARLPRGSLLANMPRGFRENNARRANAVVASLALQHDLRLVDLWAATGPPWRGKYSADMFHPNDVGYRDWAGAFMRVLAEAG